MSFSRPIQYSYHADPIWQDGTFKNSTTGCRDGNLLPGQHDDLHPGYDHHRRQHHVGAGLRGRQSHPDRYSHKVRIFIEYQSECPLAGTLPPPSRQRVCPSPQNRGVGGTRVRGWTWGSPNSDGWRKLNTLPTLWVQWCTIRE